MHAQSPGDFMIVVLPDAQNYSQYYPQILDSQTRWVTANVAAQNKRRSATGGRQAYRAAYPRKCRFVIERMLIHQWRSY
jgi:hypothetical protein